MKSLLIFSGCLLHLSSRAQQKNYDSLINKLLSEKRSLSSTPTVFNDNKTKIAVVGERDANGRLLPGVHRGSIDNMPILVPDMKDVAPMANLYKGEIKVPFTGNPPHIPNPVPIQTFQFRGKTNLRLLIDTKK